MNLAPPSSQKAADRPISFVLDDQALGSAPVSVDLVIRPEDLTRSDPSRISVQQTLGSSVWADNFGPGLPTISINGHTGWRRTEAGAGNGGDGVERFQQLNEAVFKAWHERRRLAANAGMDPDRVKLIFADALDGFAGVVAPMTFTLRRSRSRPLLAQYQIAMTVVDQEIDQPYYLSLAAGGQLGYLIRSDAQNAPGVLQALGLESLTASVNSITAVLQSVQAVIDANLRAPVVAFMNQTARLYGAVRGAISAASNIAGSLINIAQTTAQAGANLFRTLAAVVGIPQIAKSLLMRVAGAYTNIFCVLRNAFRQQIFFRDYSDIYGASNCSSTAGGRPISSLAGENPFYRVVPTSQPLPLTATSQAQAGFLSLANSDPVLAPLSAMNIRGVLRAISGGFFVR